MPNHNKEPFEKSQKLIDLKQQMDELKSVLRDLKKLAKTDESVLGDVEELQKSVNELNREYHLMYVKERYNAFKEPHQNIREHTPTLIEASSYSPEYRKEYYRTHKEKILQQNKISRELAKRTMTDEEIAEKRKSKNEYNKLYNSKLSDERKQEIKEYNTVYKRTHKKQTKTSTDTPESTSTTPITLSHDLSNDELVKRLNLLLTNTKDDYAEDSR